MLSKNFFKGRWEPMLSERAIQELEERVSQEGACQYEVQSPSGRTFTIYLQEGRQQNIRDLIRHQTGPQSGQQQQQFGPQQQYGPQAQQQQQRRQWFVQRVASESEQR
jgi:hypothetical protein